MAPDEYPPDDPPAEVPARLRSLLPAVGDTHHAEREKAELARRIAADFLEVGDGKGVKGALAVMLRIATDERVRSRTRANTARDFVRLALRASELGRDASEAPPPPPSANGSPRDVYVAVLSDPAGRRELLANLSARLGVAPPVHAARPGKVEAPPVEVAKTKPKRAPRKAARVNGNPAPVNGKPKT